MKEILRIGHSVIYEDRSVVLRYVVFGDSADSTPEVYFGLEDALLGAISKEHPRALIGAMILLLEDQFGRSDIAEALVEMLDSSDVA